MSDPLDTVLGRLSDALNGLDDLDLDRVSTADERAVSEWEKTITTLMGEIMAWQRSHSPEAEEAASDMDWERRIDEAREEWR